METLHATTTDGVRLALRRFAPTAPRRGVLLCGHAMMTSGSYFHVRGGGFAAGLAAAGIETFVVDWRGHGGSRPPTARDGWCFDDLVRRDLPAAIAATAGAAGVAAQDVVILGHSLGGLVALAAIGTGVVAPPRRLVLASTSLWLPGPRGPWTRRALMTAYDLSARWLGRAPIRALRLGSDDESAGYAADLARWARTGAWTSSEGVDYLAALARVGVPTWGFVGAGDRLCSLADARVMAARVRGAALRVVGKAYGDAADVDHFTAFTRPELAPLWRDIADVVAG